MAIDNVVASLLRIPIFACLKPLQITEVARRAEQLEFRRGGVITKAGTSGDSAYLILSGDAERRPRPGSRGAPESIEAGSLVGELAMLVEHVYGTTVVAVGGCVRCLKLTRAALHAQMGEDPDVADRLARAVRDRLTRIADELHCINELLMECDAAAERAEVRPRLMVPHMRAGQ